MTNKQEESKSLLNTFPISTTTTANTTAVAGGNNGISSPPLLIPESKLMTIQAQFGLEGLSCSSCSNSVLEAVRYLANELLSEENIVMDPNSIRVALFPDAKLDVIVSCSAEKMNGVLAKIVDCIEDIGFEAELRSKKEIHNQDNDEEQVKEEEIEMRTVLIKVEQNAKLLFEVYNTILVESNVIEHLQWHRSDKIDNDDCDTFELSYRPSVIGIRDIIDRGKYSKEIQELGGCGKMEVTDANSYHLMMEKTEQRRRQEILNWRNDFLFSASCAIPVAIISMIFIHIPGIDHFLHSKVFWNVTWEEFFTFILATPVQFYSGARFYREAYYSIKSRHLGMSFLIAAGTSAAYIYSIFVVLYNAVRDAEMDDRLMQAFETSALLIMFVLLGKYLEARAKSYTSKAMAELSRLSPDVATLIGIMKNKIREDDNTIETYIETVPEEVIATSLLQEHDIIIVRPGEKVPSDGIVVQGSTTIDESMITGESVPSTKVEGNEVIGGTFNIDGCIHVHVLATGSNTTLSKIIRLIDEAQSSKAPIQEYADYISARFVPVVTGISLLTYIIWVSLLSSGALDSAKTKWPYKEEGLNDFTLPLLFSISCLVIACPCALGLAAPTAIMVGSGVAAKHGVLIKGGEALERASKVTAVVFDKTGTLTAGKPSVQSILLLSDRAYSLFQASESKSLPTNVRPIHGHSGVTSIDCEEIYNTVSNNILALAAAAEKGSEHPLSKGIILKANELGLDESLEVDDFIAQVGQGIKCTFSGQSIFIGNRRGLELNKISISDGTFEAMDYLESSGQTAVVVAINNSTEAVIGLMDKARDESSLVVSVLRQMGIKVYMLTGDNNKTAAVVASDIGIDRSCVISDVLPDGKVNCIKDLQEKGEIVIMLGDGVNDSPAMAQADVGIGIGSGTTVAIETGDIVLVDSNLEDVILAIDLSRKVFNRIKLNFCWALGYNTLAIPIAAGILYPVMHMALPPFMAAIAMILSSLSVLASSLHLNFYKPPTYRKHYGRKLRQGRLGLEQIDADLGDGHEQHIKVQCRAMMEGKECCCPPESCNCYNCELHNPLETEEEKKGDSYYPGCSGAWGQPCACKKPCRCASCKSCGT